MKKRILVTGATGGQGSAVVKQLLKTDYLVRTFSRTAKRSPFTGVEVAQGSFGDVNSIEAALHGVELVFLNYPVQFDEAVAISYCNAFVQAARRSSVRLIVYNTTAVYPSTGVSTSLHDIRIAMDRIFEASGLPFIKFRPTLYLDNFLGDWSLSSLLSDGILAYPLPAQQKIAWTTHDMLASYAVAAFEKEHLAGNSFDIANYSYTGEEIAQQFSTHFGKPVSYQSLELSTFEKKLARSAGEHIAREVAESYRYVQAHPLVYREETSALLHEQFYVPVEPIKNWFQRQASRFSNKTQRTAGSLTTAC